MGVKFGMEEASMPNFTTHRCNVSPLRGEKPQNWPPSKLNTGALRNAAGKNTKKYKWTPVCRPKSGYRQSLF